MNDARTIADKSQRFDVDWWIVSKRSVYLIGTVVLVLLLAGGASLYVWRYGNPLKNLNVAPAAPAGARFVSFDGDVRVMRAQTRETLLARNDTQLYPGDIVQTQADGRARILLADGSTLLVRPNSVVTVRDNTNGEGGSRPNVRVAVARGQINVRTEQQPDGSRNVVETPLTRNNLSSQTGATFGVREDNTEDIRVNSGTVDTTTRGGERTTLQSGEYIALNQSGNVKSRERLLEVPAPVAPADLEKIPAGDNGTTAVSLRWQRPASGTPAHYRVEVATSPFFVAAGKVIERDQLQATEFGASDLRPGVYFWHVRAVATSGQTSEWSEPQKFTVTTGGPEAGALNVTGVAVEYLGGNLYIVRGRTQAGNTVTIAGRAAPAARNGTFQLQVTVPAGTQELFADIEDQRGNRTRTRLSFPPGKP